MDMVMTKKSALDTSLKMEHIDVPSLDEVERTVPKSDASKSPDTSPSNPRNWPLWKKNAQIIMIAFHSMMSTFMAAGIIPAFDQLAESYNVSVPTASYLTSFQVSDSGSPYSPIANHVML